MYSLYLKLCVCVAYHSYISCVWVCVCIIIILYIHTVYILHNTLITYNTHTHYTVYIYTQNAPVCCLGCVRVVWWDERESRSELMTLMKNTHSTHTHTHCSQILDTQRHDLSCDLLLNLLWFCGDACLTGGGLLGRVWTSGSSESGPLGTTILKHTQRRAHNTREISTITTAISRALGRILTGCQCFNRSIVSPSGYGY